MSHHITRWLFYFEKEMKGSAACPLPSNLEDAQAASKNR
jgi:hypothetical protein